MVVRLVRAQTCPRSWLSLDSPFGYLGRCRFWTSLECLFSRVKRSGSGPGEDGPEADVWPSADTYPTLPLRLRRRPASRPRAFCWKRLHAFGQTDLKDPAQICIRPSKHWTCRKGDHEPGGPPANTACLPQRRTRACPACNKSREGEPPRLEISFGPGDGNYGLIACAALGSTCRRRGTS